MDDYSSDTPFSVSYFIMLFELTQGEAQDMKGTTYCFQEVPESDEQE
jgi:hypothetical protein